MSSLIHFDTEAHTYQHLPTGKMLTSVTTIIHRYVRPFDPSQEILENCARKEGCTIPELLAKYDENKQAACDFGTSVHASLEHYVNTREIKRDLNRLWVERFHEIRPRGKLLAEKQIYSVDHLACGTADLIEVTAPNTVNIYDFKTNKAIKRNGYGQMLPPFTGLADCNWSHYCLQLSVYAYMSELRDITVGKLTLLHLNPATNRIDVHKVPYLKAEAMLLLNLNALHEDSREMIMGGKA